METKFLEDAGLTPKEADVYLALISLKSASIFELMGKAKVSRKSIYEILQKLLDKGLASYTIKDNKKRFNAANPERLIEILKEKEANLQTILPEILAKYKESKETVMVEVFTGKEGMETLSNNILKVGKPFCVLANEGRIFEVLKHHMPQFLMKKVKLNVKSRQIYSESVRGKFQIPLSEIRYVPKEYANSPLSVAVYGDHVNMLMLSETLLGIHVQSREIAQSFMNYFNVMWAIGKK